MIYSIWAVYVFSFIYRLNIYDDVYYDFVFKFLQIDVVASLEILLHKNEQSELNIGYH